MELENEIRPYYDIYVSLTGRDPGLANVGYHFRRFYKRSNSTRDLKILIRWILKLRREGKVTDSALHVGRLLEPEKAAERLDDARRYIAHQARQKAARERLRASPEVSVPDPGYTSDDEAEIRAEFERFRARQRRPSRRRE